MLLGKIYDYSKKWMIEFNASKSAYMSFTKDIILQKYDFKMGEIVIPKQEGIIYLGLPIGNQNYINQYVNEKMKSVEKSMFSLYPLGCKPKQMKPSTTIFLYKQFCQSIFRYHLDVVLINVSKLKELDTRQNILIKRAIGINKYSLNKPLNEALRLESVSQIYFKHKIFFLKQINNNEVCSKLFKFLRQESELKFKRDDSSFVKQLSIIEREIKIDCLDYSSDLTLDLICNLFKCNNQGLIDSIKYFIFLIETQMANGQDYFYLFYELNSLLKFNG